MAVETSDWFCSVLS